MFFPVIFSARQFRCPILKLGTVIAGLVLSLWVTPDHCPAVEASQPARFSVDNNRIVLSADRSGTWGVSSAKGDENGNAVYKRVSVPSRTSQRHQKFQHILQGTPKDHGLAPEKSHEADVSMK